MSQQSFPIFQLFTIAPRLKKNTIIKMQFDIRIPVITIRVLLILITVVIISFAILLPFSFLSFNYFYNYLIPIPTIKLPLSNYILNYDFKDIPPFVIIGKELESIYGNQPNSKEGYALDEFVFDLNYDFELFFRPYCQGSFNDYEPLMYKVSIVSDHLINQLSPYGTKPYVAKRFYLWPITNNIHQIHNPHVLLSSMNSVILQCGQKDYAKSHKIDSLIPPIFKWFIPPFISNFEFSTEDTRYKVDLLKDVNFQSHAREFPFDENKGFNIILEFNRPDVIIDPKESEIVITTSWKGIRYYLYRFRLLSYFIGTAILWATSSGALLLTVSSLILVRELKNKAQEVVDQDDTEMIDDDETIGFTGKPIELNRGQSGELYGRDEDLGIDFRVDVEETEVEVPLEQSSELNSEEASTT